MLTKFHGFGLGLETTGLVNITGDNYRDELLMELLPATRRIADEVYIIQQSDAPAHGARQTVEQLHVKLRNSLLLTCGTGRQTARTLIRLIRPTAFGGGRCRNEAVHTLPQDAADPQQKLMWHRVPSLSTPIT